MVPAPETSSEQLPPDGVRTLGRTVWSRALADLRQQLAVGRAGRLGGWVLLAESLQQVTGARTVTVTLPSTTDAGRLHVAVATGAGAEQLAGTSPVRAGHPVEAVLRGGRARLLHPTAGEDHRGVVDSAAGQVLALPLWSRHGRHGVLVAGFHRDDRPLDAAEIALAEAFAIEAAAAVAGCDVPPPERPSPEGLHSARRLQEDLARLVRATQATGSALAGPDAGDSLQRRLRAVLDQFDDAARQMRGPAPVLASTRLPAGLGRPRSGGTPGPVRERTTLAG